MRRQALILEEDLIVPLPRVDKTWVPIQARIRKLYPRGKGLLTRIARTTDDRPDYGSAGRYAVTFTHPTMGDRAYTVEISEVS